MLENQKNETLSNVIHKTKTPKEKNIKTHSITPIEYILVGSFGLTLCGLLYLSLYI